MHKIFAKPYKLLSKKVEDVLKSHFVVHTKDKEDYHLL